MLSAIVIGVILTIPSGSLALASARDWQEFSSSLGGRLHAAVPLAAPCFPIVNGVHKIVNSTECSAVEQGYGLADFRSPRYPAYMFVRYKISVFD